MSKLDELGKKEFGFKELAHILWNADTEYDLQQMLEFHVAIVKNRVAREARLEEREAMKKVVEGKIIKQTGKPTLKNPRLITYEEVETHNALIDEILLELNKN